MCIYFTNNVNTHQAVFNFFTFAQSEHCFIVPSVMIILFWGFKVCALLFLARVLVLARVYIRHHYTFLLPYFLNNSWFSWFSSFPFIFVFQWGFFSLYFLVALCCGAIINTPLVYWFNGPLYAKKMSNSFTIKNVFICDIKVKNQYLKLLDH